MDDNSDFLFESMEDVFSTLPQEDISKSSEDVVLNYLRRDLQSIGSITWAEFELDQTFVRGGISDPELKRSRIVNNWDSDQAILKIVEVMRDLKMRPGGLVEAENKNSHYWCVPYRADNSSGNPKNRFRVILITEKLFYEIINLFNPDAGLTQSEKRMAYQILIGQNPGLAASMDGVSVETKRTQLKMVAAKLHCHSQSELVRYLLSQLIHLLYLCDSETSNVRLAEKFGAKYFNHFGRLSVQRLRSGRTVRFWEFGPSSGTLILIMHGYLFPSLVLNTEKELEKHQLRLLLPVRRGFLDNQSANDINETEQLIERNVEDLLELTESNWSEPIAVLGHNMGGIYALMVANRRPDLFEEVIVASANLLRNREEQITAASKFVNGLRKLASDVGIYEFAARHFRNTILHKEKTAKLVLRRLLKDSPSDLRFIEGKYGTEPVFEWFREIVLHSVAGVASDVNLLSGPIDEIMSNATKAITFVHGTEDPYTSVDELRTYASLNPLSFIQLLEGGGHYACASHREAFWQAVANIVAKKRHVTQ